MALRSNWAISGAGALAALLAAGAASAQCTISTSPNYVQNDGGCPVSGVADPNGGCNVSPNAFQATGSLNRKSTSFKINGAVGYDSALGSRDLDWFSFDMEEAGYVNISVASRRPDGTSSTAFLVFFGEPSDCGSFFGYNFSACPAVFPEQGVQAGTYGVVVTTDFLATEPCGTQYTITVSARFSEFSSCGDPASGNCGQVTPSIPGCTDVVCCDRVCAFDFLCCEVGWDTNCSELAQAPASAGGCGVFVYNCNPPANAPANDCATAATVVGFDEVRNFDNLLATTDGPNNGACGAETAKDVWFLVQATANGNMTMTCQSPTQDVVLSVYNNGSSTTVDGAQLANNFIGCVDVLGIGGDTATLTGVTSGTWYLWRVGIWGNPGTSDAGVPGAGTVEFSLERVVWDTGLHAPVCTPAGTATNLGLSSGAIATANPQRWAAAPFTVADPDGSGPQTSWRLSLIQPEGFQPAGTVNEKLNWIIWTRNGTTKPNYATDQFASGQIPYPTLGANGEADIATDLVLPAGDYYLSVFASAVGNPCFPNDGQVQLSNFAWFVGAPNGLVLSDAQGIFLWRSAVMPGSGPADEVVVAGTSTPCDGNSGAAGFLRYTGLNGAYQNCTSGGSMVPVYSNAFRMLGFPEPANDCPTDLDGNGATDAADLSILLASWGTPAGDVNGDGTTDAADLSALLGAWGPCPN